jgi:hypothetical protein
MSTEIHGDWETLVETDPNGKWYVKHMNMSRLISEECF